MLCRLTWVLGISYLLIGLTLERWVRRSEACMIDSQPLIQDRLCKAHMLVRNLTRQIRRQTVLSSKSERTGCRSVIRILLERGHVEE